VIITSRSPSWTGTALPLPIDVFTRAESVAMLSDLVPRLDEDLADQLADRLGDLPLALAQATGVMSETGMTPTTYLGVLTTTADELLGHGTPVGYPASLSASVHLALSQLTTVNEAAGQLMQFCARLGPEPIPLWLFGFPQTLPDPLAAAAHNPLQLG